MTSNVIGLVPKGAVDDEHTGKHLMNGIATMKIAEQAEGNYILIDHREDGTILMLTNMGGAGDCLMLIEILKRSLVSGEFHAAE